MYQSTRPRCVQHAYAAEVRAGFDHTARSIPKIAPLAPAGFSASHHDLPRIYQQTEANAGEYDIPPAFRLSEAEQIVGYEDYPLGKMTPGTSCTGNCETQNELNSCPTNTLILRLFVRFQARTARTAPASTRSVTTGRCPICA
jgi:hypothetical protein